MSRRCGGIALLAIASLWVTTASHAAVIDLAALLGNSGYEDDLVHSQWTVTRPNTSYQTVVPVNPVIAPLDPAFSDGTMLPPLVAPIGDHFIGVTNPTLNEDRKGKLAHNAVLGGFTNADTFEVTVWANRGRLGSNGNTTSIFPGSASSLPIVNVQFLYWAAGSVPTVNSSDNWSRNPTTIAMQFTNWGQPGEWTSQTFTFAPGANFSYLALAVSGQNRNHDQYVAWDIGTVPEPSAVLLSTAAIAPVPLLLRRKRRRH